MRPTPQHDPQPQPQKGEQGKGQRKEAAVSASGCRTPGACPPDAALVRSRRTRDLAERACLPARPPAGTPGRAEQGRAGQARGVPCGAKVPRFSVPCVPPPALLRHPHGGEAGPGRRSRACAVSRPSGRACVCAVLRPHLCACAWCARARPRASARAATALAARCAPTGRPAAPPRTGTRERAGAAAGAAPSLARRG